ncbi:hypothetical protein H9623_09440 [Oerskovia sp. Sa1BUA8]|uniref:Uncharacterized protein n=1 Tax=Oerskovia douganii TaxID=2762210 RepID=A0A9D5YZH4_9CELL|nr:hypothetical protein [Oerskovia douganii]MBE7700526.1 hypothetical protein [Oerskovia douganii]
MAERVVDREAASAAACPPSVVCRQFGPGHLLHALHGRMLRNRPWGWRDGVVLAVRPVDAGAEVVVEYTTGEGACRVWHHTALDLAAGQGVRVHEQYHALEVGDSTLNVRLLGGVGHVPEPSPR